MKAGELAAPKFLVVGGPIVNRAQRRRVEPVEPLSPILSAQDQPNLEQHGEVLRDRGIGEPRVLDEVADERFPPG